MSDAVQGTLFQPAVAASSLRDYQSSAIERLRVRCDEGRRRLLLVAPTGAGKTTIAAHMIAGAVARSVPVLFVAHRKELIDQCSARLDAQGVPHGIVMAKHPRWRPWLPVQVASIQTLVRRELPPAGLIFVDEAHRARATSYNPVFDAYPHAVVVGLTASPWRLDNRGLGDVFEVLEVVATPRELTERGFLVPATGFAYDVPDLRGIRSTGGDYNEHDLARVMGGTAILGNVVERWQDKAAGVRTVVFAVTIEHSRELVRAFLDAGVRAEHVDGTTATREREAILERLRTGETTVVSNVGILTEGWDCPRVECAVLARPTKSIGLYLQMVGRVLRPVCRTCGRDTPWTEPACVRCGSLDVKRAARVHDHAGCVLAHGLPDADRVYSLETTPKRSRNGGDAASAVRQCEACFAMYPPAAGACPACGHVNPIAKRVVHELEGEEIALEDVGRRLGATMQEKMGELRRLTLIAEARGLPSGWAAEKYRQVFGEAPRWRFRVRRGAA